MLPRYVALASVLLLTSISASALGADSDTDSDEETLTAAKLTPDGPSLLLLFLKRTPDADSQARIKDSIAQLGSELFTEREEASEELAACGVSAVGLLRTATHHSDLEIRWRARDALTLIEQSDLPSDVLIAALRVLGRRKPDRLAEVLLDYAPHAAGPDIAEELYPVLASVAVRDGDADPRLVRALTDASSIKRALAGAALGRAGGRDQIAAVRRLLRDPHPQVRRRVALALLEARDKAAVPVLIDLLAELPLADGERVEGMLLQLAGDEAPRGSLDSPDKYREAWAEWWKQRGDRYDLAKVELAPHWRGYTLAVCMTMRVGRGVRGGMGCIIELDALGRTRWQMKGLTFPVDAQVIDEKRVLVTEYRAGQVTERNHDGDILRRINVPDLPLQARRLPNGNTLITAQNRVFEVDRDDREVWTTNRSEFIVAACPLRGGEIGICYRTGDFARVDRQGKTVATFSVGRSFRPTSTHIEGLPNGHVLIPVLYDNKVVEFDKDGREVWSASYPRPICAQRLPNGRTLVASYGSNVYAELDKNGREVKTHTCELQLTKVSAR